uniref:Uncharacterized protein n=1 Tax=Rhizophora mucronata TaxID=61149 RepID=A0A2P2NH24_RHIMU
MLSVFIPFDFDLRRLRLILNDDTTLARSSATTSPPLDSSRPFSRLAHMVSID